MLIPALLNRLLDAQLRDGLGRLLQALEGVAGVLGDRLAADHAGQIALLLFLAAVSDEVIGDDVRLQREADRAAEVGDFLRHDGVEAEVEPEDATDAPEAQEEAA